MSMGRNIHALWWFLWENPLCKPSFLVVQNRPKKPMSVLLPFTVGFKGFQIQHMQCIVGGWAKMYFHLCRWFFFLLMKDTSVKRLNIGRLGSYHRKTKAKHYCKPIKSMNSSEMGNKTPAMPFVIFF